jgi:hypothetical protein
MRMRQYDAGHIARWSTSGASLEATGCSHRLRRIALAAAMVDEFVETTQNTNKKLFLAN